MPAPTVVIIAAGQGTRMRSKLPKVLHDLCGRPMIAWPVAAARAAGARRIVVVGGPDRALEDQLPEDVELAVQQEPRGTGDAVQAAAPHLDGDGTVIVLSGDVPLITPEAIDALARAHEDARAQATLATMVLDDPSGYGRVVRAPDGSVERIVETKAPGDATPEQLAIKEVNGGIYAFAAGPLTEALERVTPDNAQGELYLPDALRHLEPVCAHTFDDPDLALGVNDRTDLATVRAKAQQRIHDAHARNGVTIVNPAATAIDVDVALGRDTVVEPFTSLKGATSAGEECHIGPNATLIDATLYDGVTVVHSYVTNAELHDRAVVGPFAYLRPGAVLRAHSKVGTFVEVKNSDVGEGAKVPHLSYVGDAEIGPGTNLGAATITANYDGHHKHRTTIGAGVRTGVDTTLVAPVTVGDGAYTGAGSVITDDVPPGALGIARARQTSVEGYADRHEQADRPEV